ncbi:SEA domain [Trinorchestia longiramus]|nr:SEA domain [Trinorchestia longiramus]
MPALQRSHITLTAFILVTLVSSAAVDGVTAAGNEPTTDSSTTNNATTDSSTTDNSTTDTSTTHSSTTDNSTTDSSTTHSSTTDNSTTDSTTSTSGDGSTATSTTDASSGTTTTNSSGNSSSENSTTASGTTETSTNNSENFSSTTSNSSGSETTDESGGSTTSYNTTGESGTTSSNSSTTEATDTNSNSTTTEEPDTASSNGTTAGSGESLSNSSTSENSSTTSATTNSNSTESSSETTSGYGNDTATNGANSGTSNSSSSGSESGSFGGGSPHNISESGIFLQPGAGKNNYDITTKGEYFACGGNGGEENIRLVARYDKTVTPDKMDTYLNADSDEYKAEENNIGRMPASYPEGNGEFKLVDVFTLSLARKVENSKMEFEISCKVKTQIEADAVAVNLTSSEPYSSWDNLRFSRACDMQPNRVVPVTMKFDNVNYDISMRDRSSEAFTSFVASIKSTLLERLNSQVSAVEEVLILSMSNGTIVVETAVMLDSSGSTKTPQAVHDAANTITKINNMPTQTVTTTQSEDYVAVMDTVNAVSSSNSSGSSVDTNLNDDDVAAITTEKPGRVKNYGSNGYFINVTVPSFLALILLIAIFLFCTVNSNSCLCQLCASNVKKEQRFV